MYQLKRNQATQTSVLVRTGKKRYLNHLNRKIRSLKVEKNKLDKPSTSFSENYTTLSLKDS